MKIKLLFALLFMSQSLFSQWTLLTSGTTSDLNTVFFSDEQTGWIAGKSGILKTTANGGTSWTAQSAGTSKDINSIYFVGGTTGWIAGKDGMIRTTSNGGATWTAQSSGVSGDLNAIHFYDASHGIAVGEDGTIVTTTNGGSTWIVRAGNAGGSGSSSEEGSELYDVQMVSDQVAYACGKDGFFTKTVNGGVNWVNQSSGVTEDFKALHFPSATKGYICYELGKVKQTNGTGAFTSVYSATGKDLNDIWFLNEHRGWVVGDEGRILLTDNGGTSWSSHNVNTTEELTAIHFPSAFTGYIVGKDGLVYKLTNANTAGIESLQDISSGLNIFPNPAADEVHITFAQDAFTSGQVHIRIADRNGKIVFDQDQNTAQGISLNTSEFQKGLYIIQLVSEQRIATGKIIKL